MAVEEIRYADLRLPLFLHLATASRYARGQGVSTEGQLGKKILREQNLGVLEWAKKGTWAIVVSTNVSAVKYDLQSLRLFVIFSSRKGRPSRLYVYESVPREVAEKFFLSSSLGSYVHDRLISSYVARRVIV